MDPCGGSCTPSLRRRFITKFSAHGCEQSHMKFPFGPDAFRNAAREIACDGTRLRTCPWVQSSSWWLSQPSRALVPEQQYLGPCPRSNQALTFAPCPLTTWLPRANFPFPTPVLVFVATQEDFSTHCKSGLHCCHCRTYCAKPLCPGPPNKLISSYVKSLF